MPRLPRVHVPGGVYHVTLRGNHRQPIFAAAADRNLLEGLIGDSVRRYGCEVRAYCWMTNHIHLAVRVAEAPLGSFVRHVASRYARAVQRRVPTTGHLFERRYRASLVDTDAYLLAVIRYIHQNPVRAGLVAALADYPWTSHRAYLGLGGPAWLRAEPALALFAATAGPARAAYGRFVGAEPGPDETERVRAGAWESAESPGAADTLPLSGDLPAGAPRAERLEALIRAVAAERGVSADGLAGPSRSRAMVLARVAIAAQALDDGLATLTEIAARFDRAPSSLWASLERHARRRAPGPTRCSGAGAGHKKAKQAKQSK